MLQLKNIVKTYLTGDITQNALNGVSLSFRENEFVSILGQSGSGKTTMLNIIGGLDRYTSGDLVINGVSTKEYKDADWDYYRNNSIGFVFQSYNLIPHQTVLANVEMALTLAGISPKERKQRAIAVLKKVGLGNHMNKKPNQMSGGQMQRVAIARALINNPDILLADEPTGALDSETSIQIMELLKEIAKDKLVIMVTHNPELAEKYSTRIVRLKDGNIISDTNSYEEKEKPKTQKKKKISMSFFTALSLSFNNLRTKKGRTILTSFAGSIGIIGIALILALSMGMNSYIENVQKETMTSYPITISSEALDMSGIMGARKDAVSSKKNDASSDSLKNGIYADYRDIKSSEQISSSIVKNNLTAFKKYLDDETCEIHKYLGENGIIYTYNVKFSVFSHNANGELINSDTEIDEKNGSGSSGILGRLNGGSASSSASNFTEMMVGANGQTISRVVTDSYDVLYGSLPSAYNEVVLVTNSDNGIGSGTLYQLGLITKKQYDSAVQKIKNGENADEIAFSYEDVLEHEFYLVAACDRYEKNANGTFSYIEENVLNEEKLLKNAIPLKITGVIKPKADAANANISSSVAYTSLLTDYLIEHTEGSEIVKAQELMPDVNVLTGIKFTSADNTEKVAAAKNYLSSLSISEKASFYKLMMYYSGSSAGGHMTDETSMAAALDMWLNGTPNEEILIKVYDEYIAGSTYEDNMSAFGKVSYDAPYSISIYTDTFENKEAIANCIEKYNETVAEGEQITYTDYVALLTSSLTTIVDGISYVLIAFVSVSLIVSCIMIGIITHISVMERTKEIGILRALGASKRNISQVFNAETFIIGCLSGLLGIGVSYLAMIPINALIAKLSGISGLTAQLPFTSSLILILISIGITMLGGLIPAKKAAKKDPVVALRTE